MRSGPRGIRGFRSFCSFSISSTKASVTLSQPQSASANSSPISFTTAGPFFSSTMPSAPVAISKRRKFGFHTSFMQRQRIANFEGKSTADPSSKCMSDELSNGSSSNRSWAKASEMFDLHYNTPNFDPQQYFINETL